MFNWKWTGVCHLKWDAFCLIAISCSFARMRFNKATYCIRKLLRITSFYWFYFLCVITVTIWCAILTSLYFKWHSAEIRKHQTQRNRERISATWLRERSKFPSKRAKKKTPKQIHTPIGIKQANVAALFRFKAVWFVSFFMIIIFFRHQ